MSIAGKIVLINAVLTTLPMYRMPLVYFIQWVINKIDRIYRKFLWQGYTLRPQNIILSPGDRYVDQNKKGN